MRTIYSSNISNELTNQYLDYLIDRVFSLLPMFEESIEFRVKYLEFKAYEKVLIQTINGNVELVSYKNKYILDLLSHLQSLIYINTHDEYKKHIFKICRLLTKIKEGVD